MSMLAYMVYREGGRVYVSQPPHVVPGLLSVLHLRKQIFFLCCMGPRVSQGLNFARILSETSVVFRVFVGCFVKFRNNIILKFLSLNKFFFSKIKCKFVATVTQNDDIYQVSCCFRPK